MAIAEVANEIRLSEVISALSRALDITEGQPMGHAGRTCLIGMRLATQLGLGEEQRSALYYALLMKDAGCSSNAAKVSLLYGADDRAVKRDRKVTNHISTGETVRHLARNTAPGRGAPAKARHLARLVRHGSEGSRGLTEIRCERGAEIALMLGLAGDTAEAIRALDEHWDGRGYPKGVAGEEIPLLGRILGISQTAEVFLSEYGKDAVYEMAHDRRGTWFDPALVDALDAVRSDDVFWSALAAADPQPSVTAVEPADLVLSADPARLDDVAAAFAQVIDAKSPYTSQHSEGVAVIAVEIAELLGFDEADRRDLRRAALLHDIGKLGVSSRILDKPGKLDESEWAAMRKHTEYTQLILCRVASFRDLAEVAAAHHERLDGSGYHRGLRAEDLGTAARVLAVADVCEALSAARPYRGPLPPEKTLEIMAEDAGTKLCPEAFAALRELIERAGGIPVPVAA